LPSLVGAAAGRYRSADFEADVAIMMNFPDRWRVLVVVAAMAAGAVPRHAFADSWAPPTALEVSSADGKARVTLVPADWKTGRNPPSQPMATLQRQLPDGGWQRVWTQPLANRVAPVSALLANGGRYLVTFDNWSSIGLGPDVIVIYDGHGALLRKLALTDVLPAVYIAALPSTVSSRSWSGVHAISAKGDTLVLQVLVPSEAPAVETPPTVAIRVRLADGFVFAPQTREWKRALADAKAIVKRRQSLVAPSAAAPANE
jgi:hypothetical protein